MTFLLSQRLKDLKAKHSAVNPSHRTSPMVLWGCDDIEYVGGSDRFVERLGSMGIKV